MHLSSLFLGSFKKDTNPQMTRQHYQQRELQREQQKRKNENNAKEKKQRRQLEQE